MHWDTMRPNTFFRRMGRHLAILAGVVAGWVAVADAGSPKIVIAHRGASGYLPEHTLESTAVAHSMGAHFIEQDVVLTKDNVPIVLHDVHLDEVTDVAQRYPGRAREDGRHYAIDFTWDEIKGLRVSERFDPETGRARYPHRFPVRRGQFRVPTLSEAIELIQGLNQSTGNNVGIYPEIKSPAWHREHGKDISQNVLDQLSRHGYRKRNDPAYVQCFDQAELRRMRVELKSDLRLVQLLDAKAFTTDDSPRSEKRMAHRLKQISEFADGIGPSLSLVVSGPELGRPIAISGLVAEAHRLGMKVHPYTLRADALPPWADDFDGLLRIAYDDADVDGVFTDFPDRAASFLKHRPR